MCLILAIHTRTRVEISARTRTAFPFFSTRVMYDSAAQIVRQCVRSHGSSAINCTSRASAHVARVTRSIMTSSIPLQAQLAAGTCEPCRKTTPALSQEDQTSLLKQLAKGWKLEPFTGSGQLSVLQRSYTFKNFRYALAFANAVGAIAESQKHHPELLIGWGHVEVAWWSHAIGGVSVEGDDGERFSIDQSLFSFIRMTSSAQPRQTKRRATLKVSSQTCKSMVYSECKVVYQL